jgi:hypothetical protein
MKLNSQDNAKPSKGLIALLAIAVLLTLWTFMQSDDAETTDVIELADEPVSTNIKTSTSPDAVAQLSQTEVRGIADNAIALNSWKREPLAAKPYNLFKVHSWLVVPPVKKVKPEPPPPPVAPPAPFTYMGKLEDTPKNTQIFLVADGKLYTPRAGEKIDQQWRLDAEEANALRLTYLPLNLPQVLSKSARPAALLAPVAEANL